MIVCQKHTLPGIPTRNLAFRSVAWKGFWHGVFHLIYCSQLLEGSLYLKNNVEFPLDLIYLHEYYLKQTIK